MKMVRTSGSQRLFGSFISKSISSGSIYENITLGCESEVTVEDVLRVAEVANAAKFIEAFPGVSFPLFKGVFLIE